MAPFSLERFSATAEIVPALFWCVLSLSSSSLGTSFYKAHGNQRNYRASVTRGTHSFKAQWNTGNIHIKSKLAIEDLQGSGNEATWSFATAQPNISHKLISKCLFFSLNISTSGKMKYLDLKCPFLWKPNPFQAYNKVLCFIIASWWFASFRDDDTLLFLFAFEQTLQLSTFFFSKLPDMLWAFEYLSLKYINKTAFCHSLFLLLTGIHTKLKTCQGVCIARHT